MIIAAAATITRPNDTTAYAAGDLVANSTTAASVTPFSFDVANMAREFTITGFGLRKSNATITNAQFGLHLFNASPTVATTGDNGVFASVVSGAANALVYLEMQAAMKGYADGGRGHGLPTDAQFRPIHFGAVSTLYGLLEARAAYTPAANEVFTLEIYALPSA